MKYNFKKLEKNLVEFIRNQVRKTGIKRAVIGLSGGIDSTVSAFLSVKALGNDNVLGLMMPYKTSSKESLSDAKKVVQRLKIRSKIVDITKMVDSYIDKQNDEMSLVRKGNIMARMRMIVLYDESVKENALVIGTGNKTEILLGYTTIFGDSACAINPVGGLYKTGLRGLAKYINVPEKIIRKKPSADLWSGQTDEGELGFTYDDVDRYLFQKIDKKKKLPELMRMGFKPDFIKRVNKMIKKNKFKSQLPVVAKSTVIK